MTTAGIMTRHYAALAISIAFNAASLLVLKHIAARSLGGELAISSLPGLLRVALTPAFFLAVTLFVAAFFFWMYALARIDLSLAYPTVSASYVLIAVASMYLFGEQIPLTRWLGMGIIIAGIIVMYRK